MIKNISKKAFVLASGAAIGQFFVLIISPILTRVYSPGDFGVFSIYTAILYFFSSISALRYEVAIPLAKREIDSNRLVIASFFILILSTFIVFFGLILLLFYRNEIYPNYFVWALPVGIFLAGLYNLIINCVLRKNHHLMIAKSGALQSISGAVFQTFSGLFGVGVLGLILGQMLGIVVGILSLIKSTKFNKVYINFKIKSILKIINEKSNFAKYDAPAALISIANTHAPILIIGIVFSPTFAGIFALAQRIIVAPFGILSSAVSNAFLSQGRIYEQSADERVFREKLYKLLGLIPPLAVCASTILYSTFPVIFGETWHSGAEVALWIALFAGYKVIFDSIASLFSIKGIQKKGVKIQLILLVVRLMFLIVVGAIFGFHIGVAFFSFSGAVTYFFSILSVFSINNNYFNKYCLIGIFEIFLAYSVMGSLVLLDIEFVYSMLLMLLSFFLFVIRSRNFMKNLKNN
ncbi:MAG: oligosaccharide flippase family protein [Comamonas sp.]